MDTAEEATTYDEMDHAAVNAVFVDDALALAGSPQHRRLWLDLGAGTLQISALLADARPADTVIALDAARHMLAVGRRAMQEPGAARRRIEVLQADAKRLPFADGAVGAILSNSLVHHLPEPLAFFAEAARVTGPRGVLFVRDLFRPADAATLEALVARYARGATPLARRLFADSLGAALTVAEVRALLDEAGLADCQVEATSDRHWTAWRAPTPTRS